MSQKNEKYNADLLRLLHRAAELFIKEESRFKEYSIQTFLMDLESFKKKHSEIEDLQKINTVIPDDEYPSKDNNTVIAYFFEEDSQEAHLYDEYNNATYEVGETICIDVNPYNLNLEGEKYFIAKVLEVEYHEDGTTVEVGYKLLQVIEHLPGDQGFYIINEKNNII
jgi:hypothetical protein